MTKENEPQQTSEQPSQALPFSESSSSFVFLQKKIEDLEINTKSTSESIKKEFEILEGRLNRASNIMMTLTVIITTVVLGAAILISLDYFKNNEERYEKFIDKTVEIKGNFYSKNEIDSLINKIDLNKPLDDFKDCILQNQGYRSCLKQNI